MTNELTAELAASPELTKALAGRSKAVGLGGTGPIGFVEVWSLPANCEHIKAEAVTLLVQAENDLNPATPDAFRKWVLMLGTMGKGKMDEREAETKINAYSMMIIPTACLTKSSLKRAAKEFKTYGFPSYGELDDFLEAEARPFIQRADRLRKIATAEKQISSPAVMETHEEKVNHADKVMKQLKRAMNIEQGE